MALGQNQYASGEADPFGDARKVTHQSQRFVHHRLVVVGAQGGKIVVGRVCAKHMVGDEDVGITHLLGSLGEVLDGQRVWLNLRLGENHSNFQFSLLEISIFLSRHSLAGAS